MDGDKHIERVRRICNALPETTEKLSHGEPTFFVRKKVFAMFSNNHHNDGHIAVMVPAAIGIQGVLIDASPEKFYKPPYVGVRGWIGIELDQVSDEELTFHIRQAWKLIAPQKLQDAFDASEAGRPKNNEKEYHIPSVPRPKTSARIYSATSDQGGPAEAQEGKARCLTRERK